MYGGGRLANRRISVGESSEEWLISAVRAVMMMCWEWKCRRLCGIVRVSETDWGGRGWIVEVYKRFPRRVHWGLIVLWFFVWGF